MSGAAAARSDRHLRRCPRVPGCCRGMITAELAVSGLVIAVIGVFLAWGVACLMLQIRCVDLAAEVACQAARGDAAQAEKAKRAAPAGTRIEVSREGESVRVRVDLVAQPWTRVLPGIGLHAETTVQAEPGVKS